MHPHHCLDHAAPHAFNELCAYFMLGAIISALMHQISLQLGVKTFLDMNSTKLGDHLGSSCVAPFLFFLLVISISPRFFASFIYKLQQPLVYAHTHRVTFSRCVHASPIGHFEHMRAPTVAWIMSL